MANSLSGSSEVSSVRTSSGMFIQKKADPVIAAIEQRIAEWTFLPIANQEAMQVGALPVRQSHTHARSHIAHWQ